MTPGKRLAALTIDFEDYRRQELRDHLGTEQPAHPAEVEKQLEMLLAGLEACQATATFFSVGRLVHELSPSVWRTLTQKHRVGCHSYEHERVVRIGPERFAQDLRTAKAALEDKIGSPVVSYRAPYFSSDGCDPWFGEVLAKSGFQIDSSRRQSSLPEHSTGIFPLLGSDGAVLEVPLPSLGVGPKRITVIGGTYFRLLPLRMVRHLLAKGEGQGFVPMVYLHPYDIDPTAPPLEYPRLRYVLPKLGDWVRRWGRASALEKLRSLSEIYEFRSLEEIVTLRANSKG